MVTNIDENFGRLRAKLAELGIEDDTILMFMSDNGQCGGVSRDANVYNCGLRGYKGSEYEGGHRIPWLVRWPEGGVAGNRSVGELTAYIDFMPTVLDLCGVAPERSFHGRSLAPLLRGGESGGDWDERVLVTDTQRVADPVKWRMSCVMKNRWRLVDRDELYDLGADPAQTTSVADQHPAIVAELRAAYEAWWTLCAEQMANDIPLSIGAPEQEVAELRTHDLRNDDCDVVWNQAQIRSGQACLGYWEIRVERDGLYEFDLRRWPTEAGHAIRAGIDGDDIEFRRDAIAESAWPHYTGGRALDIRAACLEVTGHPQQSVPVTGAEPGAAIRMELAAGDAHLRAFFSNHKGLFQAPYYVYARRLGQPPSA